MAKNLKRLISLALVIVMIMGMSVNAFASEGDVAKIGEATYATLAAAVDDANKNTAEGAVKIELLANAVVDADITVTRDISITGGYTITRDDAYTGTLFNVAKDATLTLENIIIDGNNKWTLLSAEFMNALTTAELIPDDAVKAHNRFVQLEENAPVANAAVFAVYGNMVLNSGTVIQNHALAKGDGNNVFSVAAGATLTMNSPVLKHNTKIGSQTLMNVSAGGACVVNNAEITDNFGFGNGCLVSTSGKLYVNNIDFHTNYGTSNGMFRVYGSAGYMEVNGGKFYGNFMVADANNNWNGMVYVHNSGATFVMNDGSMTGNYTTECGGVSAKENGTSTIIINGGTIKENVVSTGRFLPGIDMLLGNPLEISAGKFVDSGRVKLYNDFINNGTLNADIVSINGWAKIKNGARVYSGEGTINGDVYLHGGAKTTMESGSWLNGMVTVDDIDTATSLTVKPDATIKGVQVRVLNSVDSGDYLNAEEASAVQQVAYVQEAGANVTSPVLYYHRLTSAQKNNIVVTFDYNGGLDAQGWSGCQLTSDGAFVPDLPAPTNGEYELLGWTYAENNEPETLDMSGDTYYKGEEIGNSLRLIAQWGVPEFTVTYVYSNAAPSGAPKAPAPQSVPVGSTVQIPAAPSVEGYTFFGWQDPNNDLIDGKMPDHNVTLVGYWMSNDSLVDPPIGIKTDEKTTGYDYEVKIAVPGDGEEVKIHDEVILVLDGSYSNDEEWPAMKKNIMQIGEGVLGKANRTEMTIIAFGMGDNIVVEGVKTVEELESVLPELPGGLLYGVSSTNCESGFTGAMEYIIDHQAELGNVDVVFISDCGVNTDETPRLFGDWRTLVKTGKYLKNTKEMGTFAMEISLGGTNQPETYAKMFGNTDPAATFTADFLSTVSEEICAEWLDGIYAEIFAYSDLDLNTMYPISDVERAFVKYDKEKGTNLCSTFYYLMKSNSVGDYYPNKFERTAKAAADFAASDLINELYIVRYGNHSDSGWADGVAGTVYYHAESIDGLLESLKPLIGQLAQTNYKNVVVTDYMSKWVLLDPDSVYIVNDTTNETIWTIKDGWLSETDRPTAVEKPVILEKVDPEDYSDGGEDVLGNTNGDIYKLTWHVKDDCLLRTDNYSLRYTVTVDTEEEGFISGKDYPANGNTFVEYDEGGPNEIKVPEVSIPGYTVTYISGGVVVQTTGALATNDSIPDCKDPASYISGDYLYIFSNWKLIEGEEGKGHTIGTADLVYEAVFTSTPIRTPGGGGGNGGGGNGGGTTNIPDSTPPLGDIPDVFTKDHFAYIVGRDDGLIHPEATITRAEVATIFFRLLSDEFREEVLTRENDFSDVKRSDWYNTAISTMAEIGVVSGYPDGTFKPNNPITRAEFAAIAARFDPAGNPEGSFFSDTVGHWAEDEINIAANNGWVKGDNGKYRPNDLITRAEAMTLVNRVLHRVPETPDDLLPEMIVWPDNMDENAWYYLAVQEATNSHDYEHKKDIYEFWTALRDPRDWTTYETDEADE